MSTDPVTASDMVSVVAAALESHLGRERETWNIDPEYFREQARAVLAAISEAGTVEWGVRVSDGSVEEHDTLTSAEDTCLDYPSTEAVVSRLTLPWQEIEP